jgi:hypothetical protein
MDELADALRRLTREYHFSTACADLRRNVLDQHPPAIDLEHFAHEFAARCFIPADVTFELCHNYLRCRNSVSEIFSWAALAMGVEACCMGLSALSERVPPTA